MKDTPEGDTPNVSELTLSSRKSSVQTTKSRRKSTSKSKKQKKKVKNVAVQRKKTWAEQSMLYHILTYILALFGLYSVFLIFMLWNASAIYQNRLGAKMDEALAS